MIVSCQSSSKYIVKAILTNKVISKYTVHGEPVTIRLKANRIYMKKKIKKLRIV